MENGPLILGLEDGTIDVERMLVEPQDGHVSMDSVLCFNDKIPENAMDMDQGTHNFGGSNTGTAQAREDILNGEVLGAIRGEAGYLRFQNDFCSMREEYFLGAEFAESITNLDYGSSDILQTSFADCSDIASSRSADNPWESDLCRIMEATDCHKTNINVSNSQLSNFPSHGCETLDEEKPLKSHKSFCLQNIDKFEDISSFSFPDILSDENDRSLSTKTEKKGESDILTQNNENKSFKGQDVRTRISAQTDAVPSQKRSRKPTQRYIDELTDNISRYTKKRRESSSPSLKKCVGAEDVKKCHVGSKATRLPAEESPVIAIQVPFASLVQKESQKSHACDTEQISNRRTLKLESKDNHHTPENLKRRNVSVAAFPLWERDGFAVPKGSKKRDDIVVAKSMKKRDVFITETRLTKAEELITTASQKKRDCIITLSPKKRDHHITAASQKKKDGCVSAERSEELTARRKHHILWSIAEVRKLIDGVSQYGVGRWSHIKKIFFSSSPHRTSVDLKDKWRNLLKASGMQEQGEKKRNPAWRPLPKSIQRRVCELAAMHPYPKDRKPSVGNHCHDSPNRGTDITLNDYRRILRSINDNLQ